MKDSYEFKNAVKAKLESEIDGMNKIIDERKLEISKGYKKSKIIIVIILILVIFYVIFSVLAPQYSLLTLFLSFSGIMSGVSALVAATEKRSMKERENAHLISKRDNLASELSKINLDIVNEAMKSNDYTNVSLDVISNIHSMDLMELYDSYNYLENYNDEEFEESNCSKVLSKRLKK